MQVITNEVCRGNINVIRWSPDSEFVAASCLSGPSDSVAAIVHVVRYQTFNSLLYYVADMSRGLARSFARVRTLPMIPTLI